MSDSSMCFTFFWCGFAEKCDGAMISVKCSCACLIVVQNNVDDYDFSSALRKPFYNGVFFAQLNRRRRVEI